MWVYLNGSYVEAEEAKISPLDRGATFGDGIYEVIPSYEQKLFLFDEHFERLKSKILSKKHPEKRQELEQIAEKCNMVRIKAGLHYPSDGLFSKKIANYLL